MNTNTNRKYKDSVFRKLFGENRENAMSLYNALNDTSYTNAEDLEFTTLEDVVYIKMKNDVSFLLGTSLSLYEHQSTYNPNMPLRGLLYFADLYRNMIKENERIYSKTLVHIPNPRYIVFYNGIENSEKIERLKLHLSDAFYEKDSSGDFEWTATMININVGHNKELFERCQVLNEYSIFIQKVRNYNNLYGDLDVAIDRTMKECIEENILKEFLEKQRREAINVCLTEFDEEKFENMIKEEGRAEGELVTLLKLVATEKISVEVALSMISISKEEFLDALTKFQNAG